MHEQNKLYAGEQRKAVQKQMAVSTKFGAGIYLPASWETVCYCMRWHKKVETTVLDHNFMFCLGERFHKTLA